MSTIPPGAPGHLQVKVNGTVVSLNWSASPSRGVSYKVVRKSYARPSSVTDGTLLTTTTGCMYDDAQAENGLPLFYAVFSAYEEVTSTQAAVLARPVVLTGDVSQVTAFVDSQFVDLRWRLPEHVYDVIVVRASGHSPASPQDGTRLTLADKGHLIDRAVQNEQRYYYGIYCQYRDYDQHLLTSPGVFTEVMPEAPPEAITRVEIQGERRPEGDLVRLSWQPPAKGQSMILKTTRRPRLKLYDRIGRAELAEHGELLQGREGMVTDTLSGSSIVYYVPVVVFQNSAYIGEPQRYVCIEDIKQLEVENLGGTLRLQWAWPEHCQEALVCFDYQTWPVPERATINVTRVSRAEYEYRGHYDISGTANHDCYIVVAAVIKQNNEEIIAAGVRHRARLASKIVLSYEIKQARSLFGPRQYTLHLYTRTPGQLPDLLLINKQGRLPILKTEGEVFFRLPGPVQIADHLAIPLPDTSRPPRTFARLYLEDDRYYDEVIIHHPNEDKLRLS